MLTPVWATFFVVAAVRVGPARATVTILTKGNAKEAKKLRRCLQKYSRRHQVCRNTSSLADQYPGGAPPPRPLESVKKQNHR